MIEIFLNDFIKYIFPFFLLCISIGFISFPLSRYLFKNNWDYGFANSQIMGFLGITWISFIFGILFTYLGWFKASSIFLPAIILSTLIWASINFYIYRKISNNFIKIHNNKLISSILITFTTILFFYFINSFNSIYSPSGSEQHMNIGIINSTIYGNKLPPEDLWNSGNILNYYYFGHLIFLVISIILNLSPVGDSMFLAAVIPSIFLPAAILFIISVLNQTFFFNKKKQIIFAILVSLILICFLNPIKSIYALHEYTMGIKSIEEITKNYTSYSIRIISNAISENFNYSFTFMSLHALTVNLITGILILNLIFDFIRSKSKISFWNHHLIAIFTLIGFSGLINTWDFLGYFLITLITIATYKHQEFLKDYVKSIKTIILLLYPAIIIMAPWFSNFTSPGGLPSIVHKVSNPIELFYFWGIYFFIYILLTIEFKKNPNGYHFSFFLASISMLIILSLEIIFFRDILINGDFFRANSYYKFSNLAILLFSISYSIFLSSYLLENTKLYLKGILVTIICLTFWLNYPIMLVKSGLEIKYTGIKNQNEVVQNYSPDLLELIKYLNNLKTKELVIWEGTGERSYKNTNFVSVFTGIPTVFGYQDHQFTWRNSSNLVEDVFTRQKDTNEFFTGDSSDKAQELVKKYQVNYIVISKSERDTYQEKLKEDKLIKLGEIVFEKGDTKLIKIN